MSVFQLEKDIEQVRFVLEKRGLDHVVRAGVLLDLDVSGSMKGLYQEGVVQKVVDRILPLGMACDNNGEVDVWGFSDGVAKACSIFKENYQGYVEREMMEEDGELEPVLWGGTQYAPVIRANLEHFGLLTRTRGFLGFGRREVLVEESSLDLPIIAYFVTDGENTDQDAAQALFEQIQEAESQIYYMLIGVGNLKFQFLRDAAARFPNVGFLSVPNLVQFVSDDSIFEQLLPPELCAWLDHEHEGEEDDDHHD